MDTFNPLDGLIRGRPKLIEVLWYLFKVLFFLSSLPWPYFLKRAILRAFGAKVGADVVIKPRVNILFPWKLTLGNYCWLGEESWILNFEPITIGDHVCISQRAFLCGGNHDYRTSDFKYRNGPIVIEDGVWIGASVFISPSIAIRSYAVITAGSIVTRDLPSGQVCSGNPCAPIKVR